MCAAGSRPRRKASASRSIRALPRPRCCTTKTAPSPASPPATWASARTASRKDSFTRGMELRGKYTLFAEGARGSLTKTLAEALQSRRRPRAAEVRARTEGALAGRARTSTGRGWCSIRSAGRSTIAPAAARSSITSTTIWCRSALWFISTTRIPYLSPFEEFQRFKTHPLVRDRPSRAASGSPMARARSPRAATSRCRSLSFPGGALIGCAAGFVNVPRIKGSHNAMLVRHAGGRACRRRARGGPRQRRARRL